MRAQVQRKLDCPRCSGRPHRFHARASMRTVASVHISSPQCSSTSFQTGETPANQLMFPYNRPQAAWNPRGHSRVIASRARKRADVEASLHEQREDLARLAPKSRAASTKTCLSLRTGDAPEALDGGKPALGHTSGQCWLAQPWWLVPDAVSAARCANLLCVPRPQLRTHVVPDLLQAQDNHASGVCMPLRAAPPGSSRIRPFVGPWSTPPSHA